MATITVKKTNTKKGTKPLPILDNTIKSYRNDPFFIKKAKDAKALIAKYGVPKRISK
jgi:hypothetical protein